MDCADPDWGTGEEILNDDAEAGYLWRPHTRKSHLPPLPVDQEGNESEPEASEGDDGEGCLGEYDEEATKIVCLESRPFGFEVADSGGPGDAAIVQQGSSCSSVVPGSLIVSINEDSVAHLPSCIVRSRLETEPLPVVLGLQLPVTERKGKVRRKNPITLCTARCRGSYRVVCEALEWLGWREVSAESRETSVVWLEHADPTSGLAPVQTLSRIDAFLSFCRKGRLAQCLNPWLEELPDEFSFWPKSWVLPYDAADLEAAMTKSKDTFIAKPSAGSQGKGIVLARKWTDFDKIVQRCKAAQANSGAQRSTAEYVVQRYIASPLLLDGLKFDLRLYMVVTSVVPLRAYLFKEGLARFCTVPYQPPKEGNLQDACMHLTNFAVNAKSQSYQTTDGLHQHDEGSKRSVSAVFRQIQQDHGVPPETIWQQVAELAANTLQALRPGLVEFYAHETRMPLHPLGPKGFQIIGLDVMLDNELRPKLLELNANPSLSVMQPGPKEETVENQEADMPAVPPAPPAPPAPGVLVPLLERGTKSAEVRGASRPRSRGSPSAGSAENRRSVSLRRASRQRLGISATPKESSGKNAVSELDLEIKRTLVCQALLLAKPASQAKVARLRKRWRAEGPSSMETLPLDDDGVWVLATRPSPAEKLCPDALPESCPALEALDFADLSADTAAEYVKAHLELCRCWSKACGSNQDTVSQASVLKLLQNAGMFGQTSLFSNRVSCQLWLTRVWREASEGGFGLTLPEFVAVAGRLGGMLLAGCTDSELDEADRPSHFQGVQEFVDQVVRSD
eukprot:TRINITY_DN6980_c0_g1_i1.p1 TRINITY_DN6980_c0_g1~~TRINITY_DN6980_c0_g1_i1.p1  ORF type:complete len:792 (-),score=155.59 TRINITY_DN6980_c0_g1_i1:199-2574(-)